MTRRAMVEVLDPASIRVNEHTRVLGYDRRSVRLGIKHPSGAYNQILITVRRLRVCRSWVFSMTRARVCRLQLLLAPANAVILGSESFGTRDHILPSQIRDFFFRRLLRLAGLRWRYLTQPPHGWSVLSLSLMLRPTVSRPVSLGIKHHSGAYDQIFLLLSYSSRFVDLGRPL
jgi:hypothetical protein